jgi:hypothetical protein
MASRALKVDPNKIEKQSTTDEPVAGVTVREIAEVAYQLWHERGCPIGSDQEDWFRAEETLKNRTSAARGW